MAWVGDTPTTTTPGPNTRAVTAHHRNAAGDKPKHTTMNNHQLIASGDAHEIRTPDGNMVATANHQLVRRARSEKQDLVREIVRRWNEYPKLLAALDIVQEALACHGDGTKVLCDHPVHGPITTLEELKYLVVDPIIGE